MADSGVPCQAPTPTHQLMAEHAEPLKEVLLGQFGKTFPKFKECVFPNKKKQSFGNHLGIGDQSWVYNKLI